MMIPDFIRKCVFFIAMDKGNDKQLIGTGFFLSVGDPRSDGRFGYAVTAKHVIKHIEKNLSDSVYLRINTKDGTHTLLESQLSDWHSHPDQDLVDVAVMPLKYDDSYDALVASDDVLITKRHIENEVFGIGDDVFLVGLFTEHSGTGRNIPIVRVGNIAAMPEEPVMTTSWGAMDAYLVETRSIGGLSGSPVFVQRGPGRRGSSHFGTMDFLMLGLMHGHWDRPHAEDYSSPYRNEKVNMGIAIVVPAEKVLEVVNQPNLLAMREKYIASQVVSVHRTTTIDTSSVSEVGSHESSESI